MSKLNVDAQSVINSLLGQISMLSQEKAMLQAQLDAALDQLVNEEATTTDDDTV